jgi:hypothetical protein
MARRFAEGDVFGVPLPDGSLGIGQVLAPERDAMNAVGCAFHRERGPLDGDSCLSDPIAILLVTPDALAKGRWPVLARHAVGVPPEARPYERFRAQGWVGVCITGSGIVDKFLAAWHGLHPWDAWHDPRYLDGLLLSGVDRPTGVLLSARH